MLQIWKSGHCKSLVDRINTRDSDNATSTALRARGILKSSYCCFGFTGFVSKSVKNGFTFVGFSVVTLSRQPQCPNIDQIFLAFKCHKYSEYATNTPWSFQIAFQSLKYIWNTRSPTFITKLRAKWLQCYIFNITNIIKAYNTVKWVKFIYFRYNPRDPCRYGRFPLIALY